MSEITRDSSTDTTVKPIDPSGLAQQAFEGSKTYFDSAVRSQFDADLRQFYGIHPAGSKYHSEAYRGRSKLFRPKTRQAIRKNEAIAAEALFSTIDVVSVSPMDPDDKQQCASAEINKELLQYRLTKTIPWFVTAIGAYQDAQAVGICASYQYWRYEKRGRKKIDQPCIDLLPPENLRFDPSCDWRDVVKTSPYLIHRMPMYVKDVRRRMEAVDPKTKQPKWKKATTAEIQKAIQPYSESTRQLREDKRPDSAAAMRGITDFTVVWVDRIFMEIDGQDMVWYYLEGSYFSLTEPVPVEEVYWHGERPYQIGFCVIETHKTHPSGVSRLTTQQQAEINEVANSRIDNVKLAMSKRWKAKRGKQVDVRSLTRNIPNSVTLVTDLDDVEEIEFNDVTASSYEEQDRLNLDFDDSAGTFSQSSVQSNRKLNETVGGMQMLGANVNQLTGYQLRTWIETWVEPVLRQLMLLEQYYEDDQVILAIAGSKAQAFQRFGIDAITDELLMQELTVNVNVGMSATNPQQQVERFMYGLKALHEVLADGVLQQAGMDVAEVTHEVMGKLGFRDGTRFFPQQGANPEVDQLKQQLADAQKELESKRDPPEIVAANVALMEAQVAKLEAEAAAIEQQMGAEAQEADVANEVQAQIAEIMKRADEAQRQAEEQVGTLKRQLADRSTEVATKSADTRYGADVKAKTDLARAKIDSDTKTKLADQEAMVEKRIKPLRDRIEKVGERVKKAKAKP